MTIKSVSQSNVQAPEVPTPRVMSGLPSPYFDLEASIKVAEAIHSRGGGSCSADQLAAWLEYKSIKSGTYLTRVAAARQFGLIESSSGRFSVTDRGMAIIAPVMPDDAVNAKADAFLSVPLFATLYEQFKGKQLPPESGLKNLLKSSPYTVLPDRVDPSVRTFYNSAAQAGYFSTTGDKSRLIRPGNSQPPTAMATATATPADQASAPASPSHIAEKPKFGGGGGDGTGGVHSAIVGLLRELPPPGSPWSAQKKQRFLGAFQATIDFIYPEEDFS
jgi:hypothetical protein